MFYGRLKKDIDNCVKVIKELERYFENVLIEKRRKTKHAYNEFLRHILLPTLIKPGRTILVIEIPRTRWSDKRFLLNFLKRTKKIFHELVKPSKSGLHPKEKQ